MREVYSNDLFAIFDDFLTLNQFELLWTFIQEENYENVNNARWAKIFHLSDGAPWKGETYLGPLEPSFQNSYIKYPSGKAIDILIEEIEENLHIFEKWVGKKQIDWSGYFLRPYLYPAKTALTWHDDFISGTISYYCHPQWNVRWGGETLIADLSQINAPLDKRPKYNSKDSVPVGSYFENHTQNEVIMEPGIGRFVVPKPNRLLVMKSGIQHKISRVDENIGSAMRCSISGYFINNINVRN